MKVKHALILFVVGFCIGSVGALMKIMHYANADTLLAIAMTLEILGTLLFLFKLLTNPKIKSFLNS